MSKQVKASPFPFEETKQESKKGISPFLLVLLVVIAFFVLIPSSAKTIIFNEAGTFLMTQIAKVPLLDALVQHLMVQIGTPTYLGIFYMLVVSSLFFIPAPMEFLFFGFLLLGTHNPAMLVIVSLLATTLGLVINYSVGRFLGKKIVIRLLGENMLGKAERLIERFGTFFLYLCNILPLPIEPLSVAYGVSSYSFKKFLMNTIMARTIKLIILLFLFFYARDLVLSWL